MKFRILTLAAATLLLHSVPASAQSVTLEFQGGRVNLSAQNATVRSILAEWTRLGGTRIVNADRVIGPPVTLELQGVPERQALDIILRGVAGYMLAAREATGTGASAFDRVMILPTSSAPRSAPATTATFAPPPPRPFVEDIDDFDDVIEDDADITALRERDQEAVRRAEELARQRALEQANRVTVQPVIGIGPTVGQATPFIPGARPPAPAPAQPGVARPPNPFTTLPGTARPGEVTPAPPPQDEGAPVPEP